MARSGRLTDLAVSRALPWPLPIVVDLRGLPVAERVGVVEGALRARPGVVVLVRDCGSVDDPVLVGSTGDLRGFVTRRLSADGVGTDLSCVFDLVLACEVGSGFEADLGQAVLAASLTPNVFGEHRGGAWFVRLDPDADVPACRVIGVREAVLKPPATVIGPIGRRGAAEVLCRFLDDRFRLCREPGLLARRPGAIACVYKDMGRCPAPCDGSEPMEAYRSRAREALSAACRPVESQIEQMRTELDKASARLEFEKAGAIKDEIAGLESIRGPALAWAGRLDRFGVLCVLPSGRVGWARLIVHRGGQARHVFDVDARRAENVLDDTWNSLVALEPVASPAVAPELSGKGGVADVVVGVVCRHLFSTRKTRSTFLRLDPEPRRADVLRAIGRAAKVGVDE